MLHDVLAKMNHLEARDKQRETTMIELEAQNQQHQAKILELEAENQQHEGKIVLKDLHAKFTNYVN